MTFKEFSQNSRKSIATHLSEFLDEKRKEKLPEIFKEQGLVTALESFALRGKLIRGTLFLFMAEALGVKKDKKLLSVACAIELMHSALLIQDDIIDRDQIRRGGKTIFALYTKEGEEKGAYDPYHYGVSTALMTADVAFFFAIELISDYKDVSLAKILKYYAHEVYLVSLAESADSIFGQTKREPTKEEIYEIYRYKTARYTFSLPFEMAGITADTNSQIRQNLNLLGESAGIIFQLKDDEIGLFGNEDLIGKPIGGDIRENKKTLIRSLLYEYADKKDRGELDKCFGNEKSGEAEVELVKRMYHKYDIKNYINQEIGKLMEKVWIAYDKLEIDSVHKKILKELLEFNLERSY